MRAIGIVCLLEHVSLDGVYQGRNGIFEPGDGSLASPLVLVVDVRARRGDDVACGVLGSELYA